MASIRWVSREQGEKQIKKRQAVHRVRNQLDGLRQCVIIVRLPSFSLSSAKKSACQTEFKTINLTRDEKIAPYQSSRCNVCQAGVTRRRGIRRSVRLVTRDWKRLNRLPSLNLRLGVCQTERMRSSAAKLAKTAENKNDSNLHTE